MIRKLEKGKWVWVIVISVFVLFMVGTFYFLNKIDKNIQAVNNTITSWDVTLEN